MAASKKRKIGDIGEEIACRYLKNKGYVVIERNYWKPWGEIDVIAQKAKSLVFVEVKSVSRESLESEFSHENKVGDDRYQIRPEENMHPAKLKRLCRAVQTYLLDHKVAEDKLWRIDLACVFLDFEHKKAKVELIENIT